MMTRFLRDADELPPGTLVELPYVELDRNPLARARAASIAGSASRGSTRRAPPSRVSGESSAAMPKNAFRADPATVRLVERHLGGWVERWGPAARGAA